MMVLGRIMSDASLRHGEKAALKECHETFLHKLREKATIEPSRATFCLRTEQTLERRSSSAAAAVDEWNVIFYSGMFFSPKKTAKPSKLVIISARFFPFRLLWQRESRL
jgi:hypothetical protein